MPISTKEFIASLVSSGLMTAAEVNDVMRALPAEEQAQDLMGLARELVKRRKLTKYQAGRIYQGKPNGLVIGNYVILDKIGEGGMGEVFKAEHRRMKRVVAIKMLPPNLVDSEKAIKRFQREVEAGAKLVHPNIVTAFDADEDKGRHYLVLEYVDGQNLAALVNKQGPLSVEKAISCIVQAARGLAFAHAQGIIHRDIKPHNLLIDKSGTVKILDMGLVRFSDSAAEESNSNIRTKLTYQDQIVGTVDYMSPEQAEDTSSVDQRADIYSLGCTLYRLLVGRPPYDGESTIQKLLAHREYAVPPLSAMRDDIPPELERIYQKMVAKSKEDRFNSMEEVIAALENKPGDEFDLNKPVVSARGLEPTIAPAGFGGTVITAPPPATARAKVQKDVTVREQAEKDTKREAKKQIKTSPRVTRANAASPLVLVGASAAVLLLAIVAGVVIWWFNRPPVLVIHWPLDERRDVRLEIDGKRRKLGAEPWLEFQLIPGKHQIYAARRGFESVDEVISLGNGERYELNLVWKRASGPQPSAAGIDAPDVGPSRDENERILRPAFLKWQAERAAQRGQFGSRQRANAEHAAGRPTVLDNLSRNGIKPYELKLAGAGDAATAAPELVAVLGDSRLRHTSFVNHVAFDKDGKYLAAAGNDNLVRVWDAGTGEEFLTLAGHADDVRCVAFSPTENLLASGSLDGTIRLWNITGSTKSGLERPALRRTAEMRVRGLAFSPNGKILASASEDKLVRLWEVSTGNELETFRGHDGKVLGVAFSDDGRLGASCSEGGGVKVWTPRNAQEQAQLAGHAKHARAVAFIPQTHLLVSGGDDGQIIVWDADTGAEKQRLDWQGCLVYSLAITPDGKTLISGSPNNRIRIWDLAKGETKHDHERPTWGLALSPDGKTLAYGGHPPQAVSLLQLDKKTDFLVRKGHVAMVTDIAFSPDGRQLASSGTDGTLRLWNLPTASEERVFTGHGNIVYGLAFHPLGNTLYSGSADQTLREWLVSTGKERQTLTKQGDLIEQVTAIALSPDAKTLACASADKSVKMWNLDTGTLRATMWGHSERPVGLAFSPDGALLASAAHDGTVRLFDVATAKHALVLYAHADKVHCLAFSPDGALLATGSQDTQIKLWDLVELKEPGQLVGHPSGVMAVAFSPDGQTLVSSGWAPHDRSGDVRLWDVGQKRATKQIATATGSITKLAFSAEGRYVATANSDGTIHILRVGEEE